MRRLGGWSLVGWTAVAVGALCVGLLAAHGAGLAGVSAVLRWTARTSALLFFAAFAASSLRRLRPHAATRWLLANRRYVGVSFATSHAYHASAVAALLAHPEAEPVPALTLALGGAAFAVTAAMAATSFDRTAAWLGRRRWRRLHLFGGWYLWGIFAFTFAGAASAGQPMSALFAALALAALGVRLLAWRSARAA